MMRDLSLSYPCHRVWNAKESWNRHRTIGESQVLLILQDKHVALTDDPFVQDDVDRPLVRIHDHKVQSFKNSCSFAYPFQESADGKTRLWLLFLP